jgi:hypothetical protein
MLIEKYPDYKLNFNNPITTVFNLLYDEIVEIFESIGEPIEDYKIGIQPMSIERIDGSTIPKIIQTQIQNIF